MVLKYTIASYSQIIVWHVVIVKRVSRTFDEPYPSMAANARPLGQVLAPPLPSTSTARPRSMKAHVSPPGLDLPVLQGASQALQDYFAKDSQIIPDIGELLVLRRSVQ
jgi:hypothetical protein